MWKSCGALLLLVTPVLAQEHATAYSALRVVGTQLNRDFVDHVISIAGVEGDPQPETWKIMLDDPRKHPYALVPHRPEWHEPSPRR